MKIMLPLVLVLVSCGGGQSSEGFPSILNPGQSDDGGPTTTKVDGFNIWGQPDSVYCCEGVGCAVPMCAHPDVGEYETPERFYQARDHWATSCQSEGFKRFSCSCGDICTGNAPRPAPDALPLVDNL